jgi:nitrogen fixation NifU-like protein
MMEVYIRVENDRIADVKFKTFGCGAAIAVSSMITEMAKGKPLDEALKISNKDVAHALGGLPKNKLHCSNLGADALHMAIEDYRRKAMGKEMPESKREAPHLADAEGCYCPYCDMEVKEEAPFCVHCGEELPSSR